MLVQNHRVRAEALVVVIDCRCRDETVIGEVGEVLTVELNPEDEILPKDEVIGERIGTEPVVREVAEVLPIQLRRGDLRIVVGDGWV